MSTRPVICTTIGSDEHGVARGCVVELMPVFAPQLVAEDWRATWSSIPVDQLSPRAMNTWLDGQVTVSTLLPKLKNKCLESRNLQVKT
jgi:hypothetical protein